MRPHEVWRHVLGTPATDDVLVLREDDERFYVGVERTRTGRYVLIDVSSKLTSEVWFVPTAAPAAAPQVISAREHGHEYAVEHHWNEAPAATASSSSRIRVAAARNFELVVAPVRRSGARQLDSAGSAPRRREARRRATRSPNTSC